MFPKIIDLLYQRFSLADQLQGYPTKEERKAIYNRKQTEAGQMFAIFKTGQFLYFIQEFEDAASCFEYLLNRFPSREILNNLSAAKLQQALALYHAKESPGFIYPVELDAKSRLIAIHRAAPAPFKAELFRQLLSEARGYAEKSREIDPGYLPAYINLACIHSLGGNQAAAIGVINELNPAKLTGNAYTIRGIAHYKNKQPENARKDFELAKHQQAYMADYNLDLFDKLNASVMGNLMDWIEGWFAQEELSVLQNKPKGSKSGPTGAEKVSASLPSNAPRVKVSEKPYLLIQYQPDNNRLLLSVQTTCCRYLVRYTQKEHAGKGSKGFGPSTTSAALVKQYGTPTYTYPAALGEYWIYQNQKRVFEIGQNGQVVNGLIYTISE